MRYLFILLLFIANVSAKASQMDNAHFDLILNSLIKCYETIPKVGPDVAKCALNKMRKVENPDGYRVHVAYDSFNKAKPINMTLTIYNKFGQVFICKGLAQKTIVFEHCYAEKKENLSPDQGISILPPQ